MACADRPSSLKLPDSVAAAEQRWRARRTYGPRTRPCAYAAGDVVVLDLHGFLPEVVADGVLAEFVALWLAASCDRARIVTGHRHGDSLARLVRATLPALLAPGVVAEWNCGAVVLRVPVAS